MTETIGEIIRKQEQDYISGPSTISEYVEFDMHETLEKVDAYLNSKHTTGAVDSMEREKPFFNIVTASVNIWYRATDIDRKNIKIRAGKRSDYIASFLATIKLHEWMRNNYFGAFLNDWGRSLARYGSSVIKFTKKDDGLSAEVIPWNRLIVDQVSFEDAPVIEKLYLTEAQLRKRVVTHGYDKEQVNALCNALTSRKTLDKRNKDNKDDMVEVFEIHGELPLSHLTGKEEDEETYTQQMHVISYVGEGRGRNRDYKDFTLVSGKEKKHPYMITHLIKEDGRTLSIGAVEHLFEAQWMVNHTAKAIKDHLDLASKLIFQTSDANYAGRNALTNIESGDIMVYEMGQPLTQLNNSSHDISALQSFGSQWKALAQEITSTPDSLMGNTAPSGTAWRQVEALQQEAHSLFEIMVENKGFYIEEMMREHILPYVVTTLDTTDEVTEVLTAEQIEVIDSEYIPKAAIKYANKVIKENLLEGRPVTQEEQAMLTEDAENELKGEFAKMGSQRFIKPSDVPDKTWKDIFEDFVWDCEVDVTGENKNYKDDLATLTTVFQTIAGNPMVLQDPSAKLLFNRILETTATVSPIELSQLKSTPVPQAPQAQPAEMNQVGGQLPV